MKERFLFSLIAISLSVFSCHDFDGAVPVTLSFQNSVSYPADGKTMVPVTVSINRDVSSDYQTVTLTTTTGTFQNYNTNSIAVNLSSQKTSTINLIVGTTPGTFLITASTGTKPLFSDQKTISLRGLNSGQVFRSIRFPVTGTLADNETEVSLSIGLGISSPVTLQTENGFFHTVGGTPGKSITVNPDVNNEINAFYTAGQDTEPFAVQFQMTAPLYDTIIQLSLSNAFAEQLNMNVSSAQLDSAGDQVTVTVNAIRTKGKVSIGIPVVFSVDKVSSTKALPQFMPRSVLTTDTDAVTSTLTFPGGIKSGHSVTIRAASPGAAGDSIRTSQSLYIVPHH